MIKDHDHLIKLILIGSSGVGKTSILTTFADNKFTENYLTTIGVDFRFKTIKYENKSIKFQIWDTAGQERFRTITSAYYKGADGIMMIYDLTEPSSLDDIENFWIPEAFNYCDKSINVLLLGNKSDSPQTISQNKIQALLSKYPSFTHESVSAKANEKIYESIRDFGIDIIKKKEEKKSDIITTQGGQSSQSGNISRASSEPAPKTTVNINSQKEYNLQYKKGCC